MCAESRSNRGTKKDTFVAENKLTFGWNKSLLKLNWQCEVQLYGNCFNDILTIQEFRTNASFCSPYVVAYIWTVPSEQVIKMDASLATKVAIFGGKNPLFKFKLQVKGQSHTNCFVDILTILGKCLFFLKKWWYIAENNLSWRLTYMVKINCLLIILLTFWQFRANAFFFSS